MEIALLLRLDQPLVLQHLRQHETLHRAPAATPRRIQHVVDARKPTAHPQRLVLRQHVRPRHVAPVLVPRGLVRVVPALDGLGRLPARVGAHLGDEPAGALVQVRLVGNVGLREDVQVPAVDGGADARRRVAVPVGAPLGEVEPVRQPVGPVQHRAAHDERAADEAGQELAVVLGLGARPPGAHHGQIRARGRAG